MHNMFFGKPEEKIIYWRLFRESLSVWPDSLQSVALKWSQAPLVNHYLTNNYLEWPDPWVLITEGLYCDFARALGIYYTLLLCSLPNKELLKINYYNNNEKNEELMLVIYGDKVLNYNIGEVVDFATLDLSDPVFSITTKELIK